MISAARHLRSVLCGLVALLLSVSLAAAHPGHMTSATATVHPSGAVEIALTFDAPAYLLNDAPSRVTPEQMLALLDGPREVLEKRAEAAHRRFANAVRLVANGEPLEGTVVRFPDVDQILAASHSASGTRLPVTVEGALSAKLPPGTTEVRFQVSDLLGTVILTVERDGQEPLAFPVQTGADSSPIAIATAASATLAKADPSAWPIMGQYVVLGFEHIVPRGLDHILFVLGLFLLSPKLKPLLVQVTCFTVAHSITLGLAMFGVVRAPAGIVEPVIALSIAFVAIENLWTTKLSSWRPAVIFLFGLVHGLGFASVLVELGLPRSAFVPALLSFNVGVECGQLAVIALAFAAVGWARDRQWYRGAIVMPASVAIAAMGLFWTVQRIFV